MDYTKLEIVLAARGKERDFPPFDDEQSDGGPTAAKALPILNFINAASLQGERIPSRQWHVPDLIPAGEITLLSGDGGTGKSLLALQLAVATAAATPWVGSTPATGRAMFISAEDDIKELHRRLGDIVSAQGIQFSELGALSILSLAGEDAILAAPEKRDGPLTPTALFRAVEAAVEQQQPTFLVLDTLADMFGGNEIVRVQARQFIGMLRGLALRRNLTILLISHPSQSGMASGEGTSGSTGWNNSVRSRLYLSRIKGDDDSDTRVLTTKKANYGRIGDNSVLRWREGVFVLDAKSNVSAVQIEAEADSVFMELLSEFNRQGRDISPSPSSAFAPTLFAADPQAKGINSDHLAAAMERLLKADRTRFRKCDLFQNVADENMRLHGCEMLADDFVVDRQLEERPRLVWRFGLNDDGLHGRASRATFGEMWPPGPS
jgi:RecA-family ATPase